MAGINDSIGVTALEQSDNGVYLKLLVHGDNNAAGNENCKIRSEPSNRGLSDKSNLLARKTLLCKSCRSSDYSVVKSLIGEVAKIFLLVVVGKRYAVTVLCKNSAKIVLKKLALFQEKKIVLMH